MGNIALRVDSVRLSIHRAGSRSVSCTALPRRLAGRKIDPVGDLHGGLRKHPEPAVVRFGGPGLCGGGVASKPNWVDAGASGQRETVAPVADAESLSKRGVGKVLVAGHDEVDATFLKKIPLRLHGHGLAPYGRVLHEVGAGAQVKGKSAE